jgi:hypothetical protein
MFERKPNKNLQKNNIIILYSISFVFVCIQAFSLWKLTIKDLMFCFNHSWFCEQTGEWMFFFIARRFKQWKEVLSMGGKEGRTLHIDHLNDRHVQTPTQTQNSLFISILCSFNHFYYSLYLSDFFLTFLKVYLFLFAFTITSFHSINSFNIFLLHMSVSHLLFFPLSISH